MKKYIAMLRGINVSGQKLIKMAELKTHLEELDLKNVSTYIQSGNILFESETKSQKEIASGIANKIKEKYGWDVPVIVKSAGEMKSVSKNNPFLNGRNEAIEQLYVSFLAEETKPDLLTKFREVDYTPDEFIIKGKELYAFFPKGYGNSKFSNNFIENKLKTVATTRNWKTVLKLVELSA